MTTAIWRLWTGLAAVVAFAAADSSVPFSPPEERVPDTLSDLVANDPKPGSRVPTPDYDHYGQSVSAESDILLVWAGSCADCSLNGVELSSLPRFRNGLIVIARSGDCADSQYPLHRLPANVRVVCDPGEAIAGAIHARRVGRWALVRRGRLVRLQQWPGEEP